MKYLVNNSAISYKFLNGLVLMKKSAQVIDEKAIEELKNDYQFNSLTESKMVVVTENKPKNLMSAGEELAEKDAEIAKLKKELNALKENKEQAEALGEETDVTVDTETDSIETGETAVKTAKKRTAKK